MEHIPTEKTKIIKVSDIKDVLNSEMGVLLEQDYVCNQMNFQSYKNTITTKLQDNRLKLQRFYQNLTLLAKQLYRLSTVEQYIVKLAIRYYVFSSCKCM